jgi:hypothetical protein
MLRVSGLPVDVTKSELDKLFLPYGKIHLLTEIKRDKSAAIAEVKLEGNVSAAADELNGKPFRGQCHLTVVAHPPVEGGPNSYKIGTFTDPKRSGGKNPGGRGI